MALGVALLACTAWLRADDGAEMVTVRGKLVGGMMGIGGEHTGWVIKTEEGKVIEADVSAVADTAERCEGKSVVASGRMVRKDYVERGKTMILVVERLVPANLR